jgi:hypothetical protein
VKDKCGVYGRGGRERGGRRGGGRRGGRGVGCGVVRGFGIGVEKVGGR